MPCVLCFPKKAAGAAQQLLPPDVGGRETLRERAARLDPAIHPVLSASQGLFSFSNVRYLLQQIIKLKGFSSLCITSLHSQKPQLNLLTICCAHFSLFCVFFCQQY